jgi:predicted site-specific integrase-resolvase
MMLYGVLVNLEEWAEREGVHHITAYRWFRAGKLPVPARPAGRLILVDPAATATPVTDTIAVDAPVAAFGLRPDLDRQVARVTEWAVGRAVTVVGSALNGHRNKFHTLLRDPGVSTIVVERRDGSRRFGAEYVEAALAARGGCWWSTRPRLTTTWYAT